MARPYLNLRISQLQELATSPDPGVLSQLLEELGHRDSQAAHELARLIERRLGVSKVPEPIDATSRTPLEAVDNNPVSKVIAAARQKLLDLTRRNRLVHFGPGNPESGKPTSDSLVLIGKADAAWEQIVNEEQTSEILVLTEQEQKEVVGSLRAGEVDAEIVGHTLSTRTQASGPGPGRAKQDIGKKLQGYISDGGLISPLPLKASTAKLLTIFRKQETLESSTGDSCLFLAIGFLDWQIEEGTPGLKGTIRVNDQPKQTRVCSPLLLVHVKLKRLAPPGGGDLKFTLEMDVGAPQGNPCLIQKFKADLDVTLPDFDPDQHDGWSSYITAITHAVSRKQGFIIHPTICLGFFNFSKYRMWLDLDPESWPDPAALLGHPLIAALAERRPYYDTRNSSPIPSDDEVADHQASEDLPILLRADSSQYAALLASRNNKSITIIGPPGTGKSQTITNLIATAMHEGKRVLFVAQKMAALNVVMANLNEVGIDDFCLPLYTDKSKPSEVHQHFHKAELARKKAPRRVAGNQHHTNAAQRLNAVANCLGGVGDYGVSAKVIQAANAARELAQQILGPNFSPEGIHLSIPSTEAAVGSWKSKADHELREWRRLLDATSDVWVGWAPIELMASHVPQVMRTLHAWCVAAQSLEVALTSVDASLAELQMGNVKASLPAIGALPFMECPSPWIVTEIAGVSGGEIQQVARLESLVKQYAGHMEAAIKCLPLRSETPAELIDRLLPAVRHLTGVLVHGTRLAEGGSTLDQINSVHLTLTNLRAIALEQPAGVEALNGLTWGMLRALAEFPHDAVPSIPRQLNQRVVLYLLTGEDTFARIAELIITLESLRDHQQALNSSGIGLGNVEDGKQNSFGNLLKSLPPPSLRERVSSVPALIASLSKLIGCWESIQERIAFLLRRLKVPSVGTILALTRNSHFPLALALTDVDRPAVEAVCNCFFTEAQLSGLVLKLTTYQAADAQLVRIRGRLTSSPGEQTAAAVASIRVALGATPSWGDHSLDDLRHEVDSMVRLEEDFRGATKAANQLLTSWRLPEATTSEQVIEAFATVDALRSFPSPVLPERLGRWAEAPLQDTLEAIGQTAQQLIVERSQLAISFLLVEAPEPEAIASLKQIFVTNRGAFRWFSSSWRAARRRVMRFCAGELPRMSEMPSLLDRLATWKRNVGALDQDGVAAMSLGIQWKGLDTNWPQMLQILCWVRGLRKEALGNVLRWLVTTQISGLQPTSMHTTAMGRWADWQESAGAKQLPPSLNEQATVLSLAAVQLDTLVSDLETLGARGVVTPNEVLQVVDAHVECEQAAEELVPFATVASGRLWTNVRPQSIREAQEWIAGLEASGLAKQFMIDLMESDERASLCSSREFLIGIEGMLGNLCARVGIEETCSVIDLVSRLESVRDVLIQIQPILPLLHVQREPTLGILADTLHRAHLVRVIFTSLAPWCRQLGQGLSAADLEPVKLSTDWTRAVRANHVPVRLVQWIITVDCDHRAKWWCRLASSSVQVKQAIEIACAMGMLNIADATTDRQVAVWHDRLPQLLAEWRSALELLIAAGSSQDLTLLDLTTSLESHARAAATACELAAYDSRVGFPATNLTPETMRAHWDLVAKSRELPSKMCEWLLRSGTRVALDHVLAIPGLAQAEITAAKEQNAIYERFGHLSGEGPSGTSAWTQTVIQRRQAIQGLLGSEATLLPCAELLRIEEVIIEAGLSQVLDAVRPTRPPTEDMLAVFAAVVLYKQAESTIQAQPLLSNFGGTRFQAERAEYAANDFGMLTKNRARIQSAIAGRAIEEGHGGRVTAEMTQRALLNKERTKQRKHFPIRKLVSRAGKAMQDLCPCWLMTPLAVAQHLPPGAIEFDLVVMDEASQLTPEDAFGAIARGKEVFIVGDPAQMPPSNFFQSTTTTESEDDEEAEAATAESILELAETSLPGSSLIWHYRSQHQELIAPANAFSYHHRLIIFPAAVDRHHDRGIKHHYVSNGFFRNQVNPAEAGAVVGYLVKILRSYVNITPKDRPTIGVLTMNVRHQEAITTLLDQARQGDATVAKIMLEEENRSSEPFIVRNLENFQGDQRDIMVISCTYGPEYPGTDKVHQRFRSINGSAGKRRFNVAITRAKQQMVVFTSIRSEQVLIGEGKNEGVTDFHRFLRYCEADRRFAVPDLGSHTGQSMDSPFEEAVAAFLRAERYTVEPQVGVCGYFIDLGVRHPRDPGRFALGIECDGATYHSSRAARDRDHLREGILRERGWNLHRIWSTDWFYGQVKAKQTLLEAVRKCCE